MNISADDLVTIFRAYELLLQRRDAHIDRVQRERDDVLQTAQQLHADLDRWAAAFAPNRPPGVVYPFLKS